MLDERAWPRLQKISRAAVNSRTAEYRVSWAMFALCLTVAQLCTISLIMHCRPPIGDPNTTNRFAFQGEFSLKAPKKRQNPYLQNSCSIQLLTVV
jgi:hypothetical protein